MVESVTNIIKGIEQSIKFYETSARASTGMNLLEIFDKDGELVLSVNADEILKFAFMEGGHLESGTVYHKKKMTLQRQSARKVVIHEMPREIILFKPHSKKPDWSKIPAFACVNITVEIPISGENRENVIQAQFEDAAFKLFSEAHKRVKCDQSEPEEYEKVNWTVLKHKSVAKRDVERWTLTCVQEICLKD